MPEKTSKPNQPWIEQGRQLRAARGKRKLREVAAALGVTIGRYQNWEYGKNRPKVELYRKLKEVLAVDALRLYGDEQQAIQPDEHVRLELDRNVVMGLMDSIQRDLNALRVICSAAATDARLKNMGIRSPLKRTEKSNYEREEK